MLIQAAIALWGALLMLERAFVSPAGMPFGTSLSTHAVLGVVVVLAVAGCLWSIRGHQLLKTRRIFAC